MLDKIISAGVDVVRVNFSHGTPEEHEERVRDLRDRADKLGRTVGVLADLQGPKIRIERFLKGKAFLEEGQPFILDGDCPPNQGDDERVGFTYKNLPNDVRRGDTLLLDDGRIAFWVEKVEGARIYSTVVLGGWLLDKKGINRQGGGLSAPALTDKDREDIKVAARIQADYLAVSFPRTAENIQEARNLLEAAGGKGGIVAKIERAEALECIEEIILASDAIMVARGDLGVEIGYADLPKAQKRLIRLARNYNRTVIIATQMMESMIENQIPTRAEVFDVANAVLDGTDAVMLSAETATGKYPDRAVSSVDLICRQAEKERSVTHSSHRIDTTFEFIDEAIAMATMYTANHLRVKAIVALTESGSTALWMSRISSGIPIYALSQHMDTARKVTLYRGVYPVRFKSDASTHAELNRDAIKEMLRLKAVKKGDIIILTKGDLMGVHGGTNAMKIVKVEKNPNVEE